MSSIGMGSSAGVTSTDSVDSGVEPLGRDVLEPYDIEIFQKNFINDSQLHAKWNVVHADWPFDRETSHVTEFGVCVQKAGEDGYYYGCCATARCQARIKAVSSKSSILTSFHQTDDYLSLLRENSIRFHPPLITRHRK